MNKRKFTWNEWEKLGYRICKGEKSCGRNEYGIPEFNESQVTEFQKMTQEEAELYGCAEQYY